MLDNIQAPDVLQKTMGTDSATENKLPMAREGTGEGEKVTRLRGLARFGEARVRAHRASGDGSGTANPMGCKIKQSRGTARTT